MRWAKVKLKSLHSIEFQLHVHEEESPNVPDQLVSWKLLVPIFKNPPVPVPCDWTWVADKVLEISDHSKLWDPNVQRGCLLQQFPCLIVLHIWVSVSAYEGPYTSSWSTIFLLKTIRSTIVIQGKRSEKIFI